MKIRVMAAGAMLIASAAIAMPTFAQQTMQEPNASAFYHPDAERLSAGMLTPTRTVRSMGSAPFGDAYAYGDADVVRENNRTWRHEPADAGMIPGTEFPDEYSCIPAPRVGAFATAPWTKDTPCEPAF